MLPTTIWARNPSTKSEYTKKVTLGKMGVTLAYFMGAMCRYMQDISDEQVSEARKCNNDGSDMSLLYSYSTAPSISVKCWADVQSMDANTLIYAQIPPAMNVGEYNDMLSAMETAYLTAHPGCGSRIPIAAVLLHDAKSRTSPRFTATQMGEFVIPSQQLLKRLAEQQGEHRMREALGEQLARYEAVCLGAENDGACVLIHNNVRRNRLECRFGAGGVRVDT